MKNFKRIKNISIKNIPKKITAFKNFYKEELPFFGFLGLSVIMLISLISYIITSGNQYTNREFSLSEIEDNVYAIYYQTFSSIPAYNYEVITFCSDNMVYTFKGDVDIIYTEKTPYILIKDYERINDDKITIYLPKNGIRFEKNVDINS